MGKYDGLITIGQAKEIDKRDRFPSLSTLIHKPMPEKERVLAYMKKCEHIAYAPAIVKDVLNPETHLPELSLMSDGKYQWRSDVIYYVEKYDMELPQEFVDHILSQPPKSR